MVECCSVFEATNLDYLLRNLNISHVVVMGLNVLGSVDACVQSALDRGYHVTVLSDAILDLRLDAVTSNDKALFQDSLLDRLTKRGAQVAAASDFVRELHSFA